MEVTYKLKASEISSGFIKAVKKFFGGKEITITITEETDETAYLTMNPANKKHLLESMAQEPTIHFTPDEFKDLEIVSVELKNKQALAILKSLEKAKMIRLHQNAGKPVGSLIQFKGVISKGRAIELTGEIEKSREEWNARTI